MHNHIDHLFLPQAVGEGLLLVLSPGTESCLFNSYNYHFVVNQAYFNEVNGGLFLVRVEFITGCLVDHLAVNKAIGLV